MFVLVHFSRWVWLLLALVCAAAALTSIGLTLWLRLDPCHLCIFQRLLLMLMCPLALAAIRRGWLGRLAAGLFSLLGGVGALTAGYQSWLQLQPPGSISCSGSEMGPIEQLVEWLGQLVPTLFMASGFCEDAELVILGLSLANWGLVLFLSLVAAALWRFVADHPKGRSAGQGR